MVNFQRGFSRLAASGWLVWFVYWTCAYVMRSPPAENHPLPPPLTTYLALLPFIVGAAAVAIRWIIAGFRSAA